MSTDTTNKDIYSNLNADNSGIENLSTFNGFHEKPYLDYHKTGMGFIFITKPLLFIHPTKATEGKQGLAYDNICADPIFTQFEDNEVLNDKDKLIIRQLSYDMALSDSWFLPIFTNLAKELATSDTTIDTVDTHDTLMGYKLNLPTHTVGSQAASTISMNIPETANLDVTKIMQLWVTYMQNVGDGTFYANPDMIKEGMLDYTSSIYYFNLSGDGRTVKYWCKYTGCYPTTIPYSAMSFTKGTMESPDVNISFNYAIKEDMNPRIFEDFNIVSLKGLVGANTDTSSSLNYSALTSSNLVSKSYLSTFVNNETRDPLILFEESRESGSNTDSLDARYILSFGLNTYIDNDMRYKLTGSNLFDDNGVDIYDDINK